MLKPASLLNTLLLAQALASGAMSLATLDSASSSSPGSGPQCKCFPGDACWPSIAAWEGLNSTIGGRLVASVPLAAACHHDPYAAYNLEECAALQASWPLPRTHYRSPSSPMAAWFSNNSCNPFLEASAPCNNAAYVHYAVKAANVADYQATLAFADKYDIRLVVRNTGHDYFGKSSGAGSLALWTHFLKETQIITSYRSRAYDGPAMKLGAGIQVSEAYAAADKAGLAVVGGDCDTVGLAGGYTQGGGLGPLSSAVGLGADQALEWEVVLASGEHIVATPENHKDLYWALSGGGGGTYAAVVSLTVRAYPTMNVASANLTFSNQGHSAGAFTNAIKTFLSSLPALADAGAWGSFYIAGGVFQLVPIFGPNISGSKLRSLLQPTISALETDGIPYEYNLQMFDRFLTAYNTMTSEINVTNANIGGRLIPRSNFASATSVTLLMDAFQVIMDVGGVVSGIISNQSRFPVNVENSVNPAFRDSILDVVIGFNYNHTDYDANLGIQGAITDKYVPSLEALTPGGGAYLNEGDINQKNFQQVFYGANYKKLYWIKQRYDPHGLFYGLTAVGSENWEYRMRTDGRLCRVG